MKKTKTPKKAPPPGVVAVVRCAPTGARATATVESLAACTLPDGVALVVLAVCEHLETFKALDKVAAQHSALGLCRALGQAKALNAGISAAGPASLYVFVEAGDTVEPGHIKAMVSAQADNPGGVYLAGAKIVDEWGIEQDQGDDPRECSAAMAIDPQALRSLSGVVPAGESSYAELLVRAKAQGVAVHTADGVTYNRSACHCAEPAHPAIQAAQEGRPHSVASLAKGDVILRRG